MANIEDISSLLNVELKLPKRTSGNKQITMGKKRRPWLEEMEEIEKISPNPEKNHIKTTDATDYSLNQVDQPQQSESINQVDQPQKSESINQVLQTGSINPIQKSHLTIKDLRGNPLKLINFLCCIVENNSSRITKKISLMEVVNKTNICKESVKTALKFLCKNQFLVRLEFKSGINGWSKYSINEEVYLTLLSNNQLGLINPNPEIVSINQVYHSSNNNNYNNTTNIASNLNHISWEEIDVSPLFENGFNKNHLLQLRTKNTPQVVQESIKHFAFGLKNNTKTKSYKDPISVLMGVLRKGEAWIEAAYKSPQEIAMEQLLSQKKTEQERCKQLEYELLDVHFYEWNQSLTEDRIQTLIGDKLVGPKNLQAKAKPGLLMEYFKENEWPRIKGKVLNNPFLNDSVNNSAKK